MELVCSLPAPDLSLECGGAWVPPTFSVCFSSSLIEIRLWESQTPAVGRDPLTSAGEFVYSGGANVLSVRYGSDPGEDAVFRL